MRPARMILLLGALGAGTGACETLELGSYGGGLGASCAGHDSRCGTERDDCCKLLYVPAGTFTLGGGIQTPSPPALVTSYYLDKYEVTVGRFRQFVANYDAWHGAGNPRVGAAALPSGAASGWQERWGNALPLLAAELTRAVSECSRIPFATYSAPGDRDELPMNCVTWYEAFAFCSWDGARLPTEAEWEYAAAGGEQGRAFPWGSSPEPRRDYASFGCAADGEPAPACSLQDILPVGSAPRGAGRWGQLDMAGSISEWVLDAGDVYPSYCANCANVSLDSIRMFRGGNWLDEAEGLRVAIRSGMDPSFRNHRMGIRCARTDP